MTRTTITDDEFIHAMHQVVERDGYSHHYDAVEGHGPGNDPLCRYREADGRVGCIIGAALDLLGALPEVTSANRRTATGASVTAAELTAGEIENVRASQLLIALGISDDVAFAADVAQSRQDSHYAWGVALDTFDARLSDFTIHY